MPWMLLRRGGDAEPPTARFFHQRKCKFFSFVEVDYPWECKTTFNTLLYPNTSNTLPRNVSAKARIVHLQAQPMLPFHPSTPGLPLLLLLLLLSDYNKHPTQD